MICQNCTPDLQPAGGMWREGRHLFPYYSLVRGAILSPSIAQRYSRPEAESLADCLGRDIEGTRSCSIARFLDIFRAMIFCTVNET